jgi:Helix-hairpin-helix motif
MSTMPVLLSDDRESDMAPGRDELPWIWPPGARALLAGLVIVVALALAFASTSVPEPDAIIAKAPDLLLDLNTVPPPVLGTLPHVGQSLTRQIVAARELRPITSLDDAGSRVRGLGPATLAQIAPYLRFVPSAYERFGDSAGSFDDRPPAKARSPRRKTVRSSKRKAAPSAPRLIVRAL